MAEQQQCPFCGIAAGKIPSKKVYEDESTIAFLDISPRNPGHTLVVPKKHASTLLDMSEEEAGALFQSVRKVAGMVMAGVKAQGLSIAQSNGQAAGQVVGHVHFHVIPRFMNEAPPGLEGMLSAKRMDEAMLDKVAESIKGAKEGSSKPIAEAGPADEEAVFAQEFEEEFKL
jgi:histidine triad (HIT) family protein